MEKGPSSFQEISSRARRFAPNGSSAFRFVDAADSLSTDRKIIASLAVLVLSTRLRGENPLRYISLKRGENLMELFLTRLKSGAGEK